MFYFHAHCPLQLHRAVYGSAAFKQLYILSSASSLAYTPEELPACLCCFWEGCPVYFPATITLNPSPLTWLWKTLHTNHHLAPTEPSLVGSSLDMLPENLTCGGNASINRSSWVNKCLRASATGTIIEQDNETFQCFDVIVYGWRDWHIVKSTECCSNTRYLVRMISMFLSCFHPLAIEAWHSVASGECMKE